MSSELPRPRVIGGAIGAASSPFALDPLPAQVATATNVLSEQRGEKVMSLEVMRKNAKKRSRQGGRSDSFGSLHPFPFTLYRPKWRQPLTCSIERRGEKVMSLEVMRKNAKKRSHQGGRSDS